MVACDMGGNLGAMSVLSPDNLTRLVAFRREPGANTSQVDVASTIPEEVVAAFVSLIGSATSAPTTSTLAEAHRSPYVAPLKETFVREVKPRRNHPLLVPFVRLTLPHMNLTTFFVPVGCIQAHLAMIWNASAAAAIRRTVPGCCLNDLVGVGIVGPLLVGVIRCAWPHVNQST